MIKRILPILLVALSATPMFAESNSAAMRVSVTVVARAIVTVGAQPEQVIVTAEDVARGFVDAPSHLKVGVRTNAKNGYLLYATNVNPAFAAATLTSGNVSMNVTTESMMRRPFVASNDSFDFSVRLTLAPDARPGRYAFPIAVDATPLG